MMATEMRNTNKTAPSRSFTPVPTGLLQRKCACGGHTPGGGECESCRKNRLGLQRKAAHSGEVSEVPPIVHEVLRSPGQPLDPATRAFMEPRFGQDFSHVRIHTNTQAAESSAAVKANAYTVGRDVVFGAGHYQPATTTGLQLIAHELTHVAQQTGAGSSHVAKAISEPTDAAEYEASRNAEAISNNGTLGPAHTSGNPGTLFRDIVSGNPSPSGSGGHPPPGLSGCKTFLGGRRIEGHWSGWLGFRHLYINTYKGPTDYALVEAGPIGPTTGGGTSGAWVKPGDWDSRGIQWDITPANNCPSFIDCIHRNTVSYHAASHPYHAVNGPNSNSFAAWVLNRCGTSISALIPAYPYLGIDYWNKPKSAAPATTPSAVPA